MNSQALPESAELLRLALPLMSKYKIPVTAENYAVWYEYVSGKNDALNKKIDGYIQAGENIDETITKALHNELTDNVDDLTAIEKAHSIFAELHGNISKALGEAHSKTLAYGSSLDEYKDKIEEESNLGELKSVIQDLSNSTSLMIINNKQLLDNLEESRSEVSLLKEQLNIARKEAGTDPLTTLANRKAFYERLEEMESSGELTRENNCLLMLDIDQFKKVNDTFGHLFGDKVIKAVAGVLKKNTRGKDMAARVGGEEFLVLLVDTGLAGAEVVAENIRKTLENGTIVNPANKTLSTKITISIGVSIFMENDRIDNVVSRADTALYQAKHSGRNKVIVDSQPSS